jgi:hypothetical protein
MGPSIAERQAGALLGGEFFRIQDGKVAEIWNHRDDLGLMQQVGAPIYARAAADR